MTLLKTESPVTSVVAEQVETQIKYAGYIDRQQAEVQKQKRTETTKIPKHFSYKKINGLSTEVLQKLNTTKPTTLGQASRIPGITPAAISLLMIHLKKPRHCERSEAIQNAE